MAFITVNGHRLEYQWHGRGPEEAPTLVFLHEGLGCTAMWRDIPERVAEMTSCGALVYSRFGYGLSDPLEGARPLDYMEREAIGDLPALMNGLAVRHAILVGHSDGGSIALIHAGAGENNVLALVLEAPHVFVEDVSVAGIETAKTRFLAGDLRDRLARYHGAGTDRMFWGWNDAWLHPGFRDWNIESYLSEVRCPTLLIQGEQDQYGTRAQLEAIERQVRWPVETHLLPDCGHTPHYEQRDTTLTLMADFVRRVIGVTT